MHRLPLMSGTALMTLAVTVLAFSMMTSPAVAVEIVSESREVSGFRSVALSIPGQVRIGRGASESLTLEADSEALEQIVTEVADGVLRIYRNKDGWNLRGPIRVDLTYVALDGLDLSGSADVLLDTVTGESFELQISGSSTVEAAGFELDRLELSISGSGDLEVRELAADSGTVQVSGSGDAQLRGEVASQTITVRGSGSVDTLELRSRVAEARVSGSCKVALWATDLLDVAISGSGDISYRGDPVIEHRISGSGRLGPTR